MIEPVRRKVLLLLGRAIVTLVDNTKGTQRVQITCLSDETLSDMERFEEYGFTTYPKVTSPTNAPEAAAVFFNGNREQGIVICVNDRRYRPKTLAEGEVMVYSLAGNQIIMKADGSVTITCITGKAVNVTGDVIADGKSLKTHTHGAGAGTLLDSTSHPCTGTTGGPT